MDIYFRNSILRNLIVFALAIVAIESKIDRKPVFFTNAAENRSFYIDFDQNTFIKDSKPFRYISGSIHPYRIPKELWRDRLNRYWAAGLNAIQTYVFWNEHEPEPNVYDFEGQNNIFEFIKMAQEIGFLVILRPGGFPWHLLVNSSDSIIFRSSEENYMSAVRRWFKVLLPKIVPLLYNNGGPIISVQIENEYGSYYTCDEKYKVGLRDLMISILGKDIVYFTTDPYHVVILTCGQIPNVYSTVDFGINVDPQIPFRNQRQFSPKGPLVNSEFYPGWLDFWGFPHQTRDTETIIKRFNQMMIMNASVNFYMFHGGTNFGFSNGADPPYLPQPTSYDYDAPISEAGDITSKYLALRNAISNFLPLPSSPIPLNTTKMAYGAVQMSYHVPLVDAILELSNKCVNSTHPLSFEKLGQGYGFILYHTILDDPDVDGKTLEIDGIRDRAYVQIGNQSVGILYRLILKKLKINLKNNTDRNLYIIVENMGRLNFGNELFDSKGIISNVTLDDKILTGWNACLTNNFIPNYQTSLLKKDRVNVFDDFIAKYATAERSINRKQNKIDFKVPAIYIGEFTPKIVGDTFLKIDRFAKGISLIKSNNKLTNLGRYWPNAGPQITLYTPSVFLAANETNYISLIDFEGSSCDVQSNCQVEFIDYPIINSF